MDNRAILFLDSGVGGIPYCRDFVKRSGQETVYYLADRENFPYGPRRKEEIASILISLTNCLISKINPKMAVVACNTASIAALEPLRKNFPELPFVGTVPAIKPAASASRNGRVGVLATERTIDNIRSLNLAPETCEIFGIAAPELVEFIEQKFDSADEAEKAAIVKKYIDKFKEEGVDTVVLGCTHFLFLHDEFRQEAEKTGANISIFDSLEGITKRIEYLINENDGKLRAENNPNPVRKFLLTGTQAPDSLWKNRADAMGFTLSLVNEL
jgi:glutamate racemase